MDYVTQFFQKKEEYTVSASLMNLKSEYSPGKKTLHLFVEDDDDYDFYFAFAVRIYNDHEIIKYSQKGKSYLLDSFSQINWSKYNSARVLFFYDKDYDDVLGINTPFADNLFKTMHYSLENYVVTDEVFKIIMTFFYDDVPTIVMDKVTVDLKPFYETFIEKLKLITCWILVYRKSGEHCDLDEVKFDDLFVKSKKEFTCICNASESKLEEVKNDASIPHQKKKAYRRDKLKPTLERKTNADPKHSTIRRLVANLRLVQSVKEVKAIIRGKYEFWFIFKVFFPHFQEVQEEFNNAARAHNSNVLNRVKIPLIVRNTVINEGNIFGIVPQKMRMPKDIEAFLRYNYSKV